MIVLKLFIKALRDRSMVECQQFTLQQGYGIKDDLNACIGSPRQVLIVGQPALDEFGLSPGDLYENILVDAPVEHLTSGQLLQIGDVLIRLTFLCEPCSFLETIRQGLTRQIKGKRGILGMVVKSGTIAVGDRVRQTPYCLPPLAEDAKVDSTNSLPEFRLERL